MRQPDNYPGALVPSHLTSLTVDKLPADRAFFVSPGDPYEDDADSPVIFVADDRQLRMSRIEIISPDTEHVPDIIGRVGIMRTLLTDPQFGFREAYVADLRFIDNNGILDIGSPSLAGHDQELFMDWIDMVDASVVFDGFIAPEPGDEFDVDEKLSRGVLYGSEAVRPALKRLRKRGNRAMKSFMMRQAKPDVRVEADAGEPEDMQKPDSGKPKSLDVTFSHNK